MVDKTPVRAYVLPIFSTTFTSRANHQKSYRLTETALDSRSPCTRLFYTVIFHIRMSFQSFSKPLDGRFDCPQLGTEVVEDAGQKIREFRRDPLLYRRVRDRLSSERLVELLNTGHRSIRLCDPEKERPEERSWLDLSMPC